MVSLSKEHSLTMNLVKATKSNGSSLYCLGCFWGLSDQKLKGMMGPYLTLRFSFHDSCLLGAALFTDVGYFYSNSSFKKLYFQLAYKVMGFCKVS